MNKANRLILFVYVISIFLYSPNLCFTNINKPVVELQFFKNSDGSLAGKFLQKLQSYSKASIFIETGTFLGATTGQASPYFKEIHSLELSNSLYLRVVDKFKNDKNVFLYNGDSAAILPNILSNIKGKMVFWLDGHYSGGITARGSVDTPIMLELEAIKKSGSKDSIILIDDIRCFEILPDYPMLIEVYKSIKSINSLYNVKIMGDILIAYLEDELFEVSPVIEACTVSRFAESLYAWDEILKFEQIIARVQGEEKDTLYGLNTSILQNRYSCLWYGLICMQQQCYDEAAQNFKKAQEMGLAHWRIFWYLGFNAYQAKWYEQARQYLTVAVDQAPFLDKASELLKTLVLV